MLQLLHQVRPPALLHLRKLKTSTRTSSTTAQARPLRLVQDRRLVYLIPDFHLFMYVCNFVYSASNLNSTMGGQKTAL